MNRTAVRPSSEDGETGPRTAPTKHPTKAADDQDRDKAEGDDEELHRRSDRLRTRRERHPAATLLRQERAPQEQRGTRTKNRRRTGHRAGHSSTAERMGIVEIRTPRPHGAGQPNDRDRARSEHADATRKHHRQTAPSRTRSSHDERRSDPPRTDRQRDRTHPDSASVPLAHRPERPDTRDPPRRDAGARRGYARSRC